ncbi:unnamed protein product, partial [Angiostrongylus costaricensis]|uniref:Protein sleepless n=1 Tax=Angiostrongylus costaricensis TaxID=334426 RepID=A0A158PF54_ANGCS
IVKKYASVSQQEDGDVEEGRCRLFSVYKVTWLLKYRKCLSNFLFIKLKCFSTDLFEIKSSLSYPFIQMRCRRLITFSSLPALVWSLSCYICGDNNLEEFEECSTQFQYDCQSYSLRFPRDETIYCRTTRHKAPNNTYTVMKECISEQDHYRTFPGKGYTIEEECDLAEVNGEEDLTNHSRHISLLSVCYKNISDICKSPLQKNPELFGDIDLERSGTAHSSANDAMPIAQSSSKVDFAAPSLPLPPIIPVNDPRTEKKKEKEENWQNIRDKIQVKSKLIRVQIQCTGERHETLSRGQGNFIGNTGINHHVVAVTAPLPARELQAVSTGLRCSQCGESDLHSEDSDCNRQVVVDCQESDPVCFTRQTLLGRGQAAVEKMCVSWQAVKAEFPTSTMNSCGETSQGRVRYCTCSANQCNSVAISSQVAQYTKTEALPPVVKIQPPASLPPPGVPEMPAKSSSAAGELSIQHHHGAPIPEHTKLPTDTILSREYFLRGKESLSDVLPIVPTAPSGKSAPELSALRCAVCLESGMSDPTTDCSTSAPALCSAIETFCLTRQTQHEDATFTMEKRCVSEAQAESFVESSDVRSGCATANGGLINYCLCQGDLCNHDALLAQAQISGVRIPETQPKPAPPAFQEMPRTSEPPKLPSTDVPFIFVDDDEAPHMETSPTPEIRYCFVWAFHNSSSTN